MPKTSILIPVFNVDKYLSTCLDSVVNQTEKDIEIVCIDDASEDTSKDILTSYAKRDSRIQLYYHEDNKGLCQTRKEGVEKATGEYILFLDGDDFLALDACEKLYDEIKNKEVDFIQFGTNVLPEAPGSDTLKDWAENFMCPNVERLYRDNLLSAFLIERKFNCNLVNKIWKTEICKRAYEEILDGYFVSAEDRYATFILSYYAKSCDGMMDKLYNYRLGVGVTGGEKLDIDRFKKRCQASLIVDNVKSFLQKENKLVYYKAEYETFRDDILGDCIDCWYTKLEKDNWGRGYEILAESWGAGILIGAIAKAHFEAEDDVLKRARKAEMIKKNNVGIYYRYLGYVPMQLYIEAQVKMLQQSGYEVILFTDDDAPIKQMEKNPYDDQIVFLPPSIDANWDEYNKRGIFFENKIREHSIQYMFYASPTSHIAWLDMLLLRTMRIDCLYMDEEYNKKIVQLYEEKEQASKELETLKESKEYKLGRRLLGVFKKV